MLQATREVPRRLQHPKRSTVGVRVPDHPVSLALLAELDGPMLSSTLILAGSADALNEAAVIRERLENLVDGVFDAGACGRRRRR